MGEKKDTIYLSSKEALVKIFVLVLTMIISILASLFDYKSCYITIIVQAVNNMYDFYKFTDNKKYATKVKRESITIMIFAIFAIGISINALAELYFNMKPIGIKLFVLSFVTIPIVVVYDDYKINVMKENKSEV